MKIFGYTLPQMAKSIVGFFTPGLIALGVAVATDSPGAGAVTSAEWIGIVLAMFVTGGLVFGVPNAKGAPPARPQLETGNFQD